jgi:hypothetical protein
MEESSMKTKLAALAFFMFLAGNTAFSASKFYLPHIAIGSFGTGSFRTTFIFFNNQSTASNVALSLTNDDGTPLSVTITGLGTNSTFTFSLGPGATRILQTDNSGNAKSGAAIVTSDLAIGVSGLFTIYDINGKFVTEVGVNNSDPLRSFVIPVQISGSTINTGLALFNPGATDSQFTATLTNVDGTVSGTTAPIPLATGQHKGVYVGGDLFKDVSNFQGTLTVQSSVAISAMTLRQNTPSSTLSYTSSPVVSTAATQTTFNLAQVVNGTSSDVGYKTTFMLFNLSSSTANVTLALTKDDGTPLSVTIPSQSASAKSTFNLTIGAGKSLFLQTDGTGALLQGAAAITSDVPIGAAGVFTQFDSKGNFATEAGVQSSPALTDFTLPIDSNKPTADTGIALFNPGSSAVTVTPRFLNATGISTTATTPIQLAANGHSAGFFGDIFPGLGQVQGSLAISVLTPISALTMRSNFSPYGMTSLPVVQGVYQAASSSGVTQDGAVSHSVLATSASSLAVTHITGTGSNRLLLVGVDWNDNTAASVISSVTFTPDGGAAVSLTEVLTQKPATVARYAAIYSLVNPPSGKSGTVTITFTDAVPSGVVAGAANFAGVDQATPLGTAAGFASSDNQSTALSVTLTGLAGNELIFDSAYQGGSGVTQTLTASTGQTELWNDFATNTRAASSTLQATSSSATMSWTAGSTGWSAMVAVPIKPAK